MDKQALYVMYQKGTPRILKGRASISLLMLLFLSSFLCCSCNCHKQDDIDTFRIFTEQSGVYEVSYQEFVIAGLKSGQKIPSNQLQLQNMGKTVPIKVIDGGDGEFGPGDQLYFFGHSLQGKKAGLKQYTKGNVYFLNMQSDSPFPMTDEQWKKVEKGCDPNLHGCRARVWVEKDNLRFALTGKGGKPIEKAYMDKLSTLSRMRYRKKKVVLPGLSTDKGKKVRVRVALRGWSRLPEKSSQDEKDHFVELRVNGVKIGDSAWNNKEQNHIIQIDKVPAEKFSPDGFRFVVRVVPRIPDGQTTPLSDVVLLDWIQFDYPVQVKKGEKPHYMRPAMISGQKQPANVAKEDLDMLILYHHKLFEGARAIAALHEKQGMKVAVADVQQAYDKFNHGIAHPKALRKLIRENFKNEDKRTRYVLLLGDTTWEAAKPGLDNEDDYRNLIPTWKYGTDGQQGPSDQRYVNWDKDHRIAIGRLPAANMSELSPMIAKIRTYIDNKSPGQWKRRALWITDGSNSRNKTANTLARTLAVKGLESDKVFPIANRPVDAGHIEKIIDAFAKGFQFVHFAGHGAKQCWRTAEPDLRKNFDLFNLETLDRLKPGGPFPIIIAMTCYSAAIDDPKQESIGEKFLGMPDKGAAAVIAATWRNKPNRNVSMKLMEALVESETVGEALIHAKSRLGAHKEFVHQYLLLGDPAMPVVFPDNQIKLKENRSGRISGETTKRSINGQAVVEWGNGAGEVIHREQVVVKKGTFEAAPGKDISDLRFASAYAKNKKGDFEAVGGIKLKSVKGTMGRRQGRSEKTVAAAGDHSAQTDTLSANKNENKWNKLKWATASEDGLLGFHVYRSKKEKGPFKKITLNPIEAAGSSDQPNRYEYKDESIAPNTVYFYYVESVNTKGERKKLTPIIKSKAKAF